MQVNKVIGIILFFGVLFCGCSINRSKNLYERTIGHYKYDLKLDANKLHNNAIYEFTLRVSRNDDLPVLTTFTDSKAEYNKANNYLVNDFQKQIKFVIGRDTLYTDAYQYVSSGNLDKYADVIFMYKPLQKELANAEKVIQIDDELWGNGVINFRITQ